MEYELVLTHHGVKGMKWGVRKARESNGSKGTKWDVQRAREAKRNLRQKENAYERAKTKYKNSAKTRRGGYDPHYKEKADNYKQTKSDYKSAKKEFKKNAPARVKAERAAEKGAKKAAEGLAKIGFAYVMDQTLNAGKGTKAAKETLQVIGMLSVTAIARARGATDIHWYDKQGRKIV